MSFKPHIEHAHALWKEHLEQNDLAIDATCGNGHDSVVLAKLTGGNLWALDIQEKAIENTKGRLKAELDEDLFSKVQFHLGCHSKFPDAIKKGAVKLVVYNLGYLPGSDKAVVTERDTTITSLNNALLLLKAHGLLSITCYPRHDAGQKETEAVLSWAASLDKSMWVVEHKVWPQRERSPSLLIIKFALNDVFIR
jgi:hypothetical protein